VKGHQGQIRGLKITFVRKDKHKLRPGMEKRLRDKTKKLGEKRKKKPIEDVGKVR